MRKEFWTPIKGSRATILTGLLEKNLTAIQLQHSLGMNESAVRKHLDVLERDGLISHHFERADAGRPKKVYGITPLGRKLLPKKSDLLLKILSRKVVETYGERAFTRLLNSVADELACYFVPSEAGADPQRRLKIMTKTFDELGFITSLSKKGDEYRITYRNCAFADAIPALGSEICEIHRGAVRKAVGGGEVEWSSCIARGDNACTQIITLKSGTGKK